MAEVFHAHVGRPIQLFSIQKPANKIQNVWADTITFDSRPEEKRSPDDAGYIHGDGVLMYPGEERLHPDEDRGVRGPVSTVQLANLRRGLQDHQYLTLARRLGLHDVVREAVQTIVPRVFSEAGETVSFPETGDPYEAARLKLARAIARAAQARTKSPVAAACEVSRPTATFSIPHGGPQGDFEHRSEVDHAPAGFH